MEITKLHIYGLGIVAANKPLTSKDIEVTPIEDLPFLDGEISDNVSILETGGKSKDGSTYATSIDVTASIRATWLPVGISNRVTPPDVRRGEKVVIYRYGETDRYYWTTLEYDMKLRKLETVIFAFSNTQKESETGTASNTYFFEISTHKKLITLYTSKSDGEPFAYTFQINTKDGNFIFQDDIGNFISLDSANVRIELKNADESHVDIDRKDIRVYAPNNIEIKAGNKIDIIAGNSVNVITTDITTKADATLNTVPETITTGNCTINQNLKVDLLTTTSGLRSISSGGSGRGPISGSQIDADEIDIDGTLQVAGTATVGKLISSSNIEAPNV